MSPTSPATRLLLARIRHVPAPRRLRRLLKSGGWSWIAGVYTRLHARALLPACFAWLRYLHRAPTPPATL